MMMSMLGIRGLEAEGQAIKLFLESTPMIIKIAQIRSEIRQRQEESLNQRHRTGEITEVVRFGDNLPENYRTGEEPGRSSKDIEPTIRVIKVLKVEIEDNSEEERTQKFIMTMLTAITLSVIVQWLFGKRKRRNKVQSTPDPPPQEQQEEESEYFEVASEPQDANEVETQEAEEAEAIQQAIAEATQEVIEDAVQQEAQEEQVTEAQIQGQQSEPSDSSTIYQRHVGRKLYATRSGEKYHLTRGRQGLKGYNAHEKEAGYCCLEDSQRVLVFNRSQPTPQSETELSFGDTTFYHRKGCTQFFGNRRNRPICIFCEDEERVLNYARNRTPATGSQNT